MLALNFHHIQVNAHLDFNFKFTLNIHVEIFNNIEDIYFWHVQYIQNIMHACLQASMYTFRLTFSLHVKFLLLTHICRWWLIYSSQSEKNTDRWTIYRLRLGKGRYFQLGHSLPSFAWTLGCFSQFSINT